MNDPPHLQHCGYCFVFGVGRMASFVFHAHRCATVVFQLESFPLKISFGSVVRVLVTVHSLMLVLGFSSSIGVPFVLCCCSFFR